MEPPTLLTGDQTVTDVFRDVVFPIFNAIVGLVIAVAVVVFLFGVARFIATAGDDKSRADGKRLMVWGTVALFVMISVWGIVAIIKVTFFGT